MKRSRACFSLAIAWTSFHIITTWTKDQPQNTPLREFWVSWSLLPARCSNTQLYKHPGALNKDWVPAGEWVSTACWPAATYVPYPADTSSFKVSKENQLSSNILKSLLHFNVTVQNSESVKSLRPSARTSSAQRAPAFTRVCEQLPIMTPRTYHRMFGVGRDLCGSSSPTLLPKQGHLQQAAQDRVQTGLEYLQRRRLHNLPGQPVPVLCQEHDTRHLLFTPVLCCVALQTSASTLNWTALC